MTQGGLNDQTLRNSPHEWHVLRGGAGASLLFLHGAGGSAQSFEPVLEHMSGSFHVIAPDLPGHGSTRLGAHGRSGLNAMAEDIASLVTQQFEKPLVIIGHSAGGAVALRLSRLLSPRGLFLINPALDPFNGVAGWAFPALARGLAAAPFSGDLLAGVFGRERRIVELLEATGSRVSDDMIARYLTLARNPQHIRGTLRMMAAWDVGPLRAQLEDYDCQTRVLVARGDKTLEPDTVSRAVSKIPNSRVNHVDGGHLVQEEFPELIAEHIAEFVKSLA